MKTSTSNQYAALHGFYVGIMMISVSLVFYLTTGFLISEKGFSSWAPTVLFITGLYFFTRQYRNKFFPTDFSFSSAFKVAFLIGLYADIIITFFYYLLFKYTPELLHQMLLMSQKTFQESGMSDKELETMMKTLQTFLTPGLAAFSNFFGILIQTTLASLIISIILRRKTQDTTSGYDRDMANIE
ncbi:MAG TPA: DUF4199 domain-containing protein [Salinivirgaceae bacterium]|nr:DUF4199 domain-containing protein [Salinivirgaceae bacterium]